MSKWLGYTVELFSNGQWFNIDQWHRHANGELRHRYLYTAPERDIFSSAHDELALSKERICFSDLAAETQDIICAENPAFERSTFDSWDFFIWGNLSDLEMLLQKPVIHFKGFTQRAACQDSRPNPDFSTDHPVLRD